MFLLECPACNRVELVGIRRLAGLVSIPDGIEVHLDCRCGHRVVERTGRPSPHSTVVPAAAPGAPGTPAAA